MKEKDAWKLGLKTYSEITAQDEKLRRCAKCPVMDKVFTDPAFYTHDMKDAIIGRIMDEGCRHVVNLLSCPSPLIQQEIHKKLGKAIAEDKSNLVSFKEVPLLEDHTLNAPLFKMLDSIGHQIEGYNYTINCSKDESEDRYAMVIASRNKRLNEDIQSLIDFIKTNF